MKFVVATLITKSETREDFKQSVNQILSGIRAEHGCISYRFFQSAEDENTFCFVEEWENQADLDSHWRTEGFGKFLEALPAIVASSPDIKVYEVSSVKGLEAVEEARS